MVLIGIAGLYDLDPESPIVSAFMGNTPPGGAEPANYATRAAPPVLLAHGRRDTTVPASQSTALDAALRGAGSESAPLLVPGDHLFAFPPTGAAAADTLATTLAFLAGLR